MRKLNRMIGATFGALILATAGVAALSGPAQAAAQDCKTGTTVFEHRGDSGFGTQNDGVWGYTDRTSKWTVCRVMPAAEVQSARESWDYRATVQDSGTFVTLAGEHLSPMKAEALKGGVEGTFTGGFTATFTATADWDSYNGKHDGKKYVGAGGSGSNPKTSEFISSMFGADFEGSSFDNAGWGWTYTTGCESWTNATGPQGEDLNSGDITGETCPTPSPTASPRPDPSAGDPSPSATAAPGAGGGLPVTGTAVGGIAVGAVALIAVGGVLFFVARRRRQVRFTA